MPGKKSSLMLILAGTVISLDPFYDSSTQFTLCYCVKEKKIFFLMKILKRAISEWSTWPVAKRHVLICWYDCAFFSFSFDLLSGAADREVGQRSPWSSEGLWRAETAALDPVFLSIAMSGSELFHRWWQRSSTSAARICHVRHQPNYATKLTWHVNSLGDKDVFPNKTGNSEVKAEKSRHF